MNKYEVTWVTGIEENKTILKSILMEAENIDKVDYCSILPEEIRSNIYYTRILFTGPQQRWIDYGSHSKFIEVRKIN